MPNIAFIEKLIFTKGAGLNFEFECVRNEDILVLNEWFKRPHIQKWFGDTGEWLEEIRQAIGGRQNPVVNGHFIAKVKKQPFGFVQYYNTELASKGVWSSQPAGTFGIDFCIAAIDNIGKGFGTELIRSFVEFTIKEVSPKRIIADPDLENKISIKVLEKNGFVFEAESGLWIKDIV